MLYDTSRRVKKKRTPSRLRKTDTACTVRSGGEGEGEECLLTDAVWISEIRCQRVEEIPVENNQLIRLKHPPTYIPGILYSVCKIVGRRGEDYEKKVQQAVVLKKRYFYVQYHLGTKYQVCIYIRMGRCCNRYNAVLGHRTGSNTWCSPRGYVMIVTHRKSKTTKIRNKLNGYLVCGKTHCQMANKRKSNFFKATYWQNEIYVGKNFVRRRNNFLKGTKCS